MRVELVVGTLMFGWGFSIAVGVGNDLVTSTVVGFATALFTVGLAEATTMPPHQ